MILCCGHVFSCKTQISLKRFELSFFKLQYKLLPQGLETGNTPINLSENVCILKMAHDSLKLANFFFEIIVLDVSVILLSLKFLGCAIFTVLYCLLLLPAFQLFQHQNCWVLALLSISAAQHWQCFALALLSIRIA